MVRKINETSKVKSEIKIKKFTEKQTFVILSIFDIFNNEQNYPKTLNFKNLSGISEYWKNNNFHSSVNSSYVYDCVNDLFVIHCCEYVVLGIIPFYFKATMNNVGMWDVIVPIPKKLLDLNFNQEQLNLIESYKVKRPESKFSHSYLQFITN